MQARREAQLGAEGLCFNESGCTPDDVDLVGHVGGFLVGIESLVAHHPDSGTTIVIHANDNAGFTDEGPAAGATWASEKRFSSGSCGRAGGWWAVI